MGDCPCKADEIMTEAKSGNEEITVSSTEIIAALNESMLLLAGIAEEDNPDHRAAVLKLEATIKFIRSRWEK